MMMGDSSFNIVNGQDRPNDVRTINKYNQDNFRAVGDAIMSGAGRPVRSVNARIDIGQTVNGKKVYRDQYPLTANQVITADEINASMKSQGKRRFEISSPNSAEAKESIY